MSIEFQPEEKYFKRLNMVSTLEYYVIASSLHHKPQFQDTALLNYQ